MMEATHNWGRLLPLFLATTLVPVVCLCWLGWKVVEEDRLEQRDSVRLVEQRDQAAKLAVTELQHAIAEAEKLLDTFIAEPVAGGQRLPEGIALIAFGHGGAVERAGIALPYYPALPRSLDPPYLAAIDELEFQKDDFAGALSALHAMAADKKSGYLGDVLLRIARIQTKRGDFSSAIDAFTEMGKLGAVQVEGLPAGLIARQGRALIFEKTGRRDDLQREAATICEDIENGRWILVAGQFQQYDNQAREWLGRPRPPVDVERLALAAAADSLWGERRSTGNPGTAQTRRLLRAGDLSILTVTHSTPTQTDILLMTPRFLESGWLRDLRSKPSMQNFDFALTEADGRAVLGQPDAPASRQSIQETSTTHLPWTVHVIGRATGPHGLAGQTKLVLAGIVMMALVAVAGGYFINRAIARELRVARLQADFVAAVSHEFRTPLTSVRQLAELLVKGRVSSDARRQQFYETLLHESERLQRLVDGLLNFGRMEAGQLQYRFESIDAGIFVREIVSDFEREVAGRGYHIELHGDGGLPPIRADRELLARVFWNLLDNAVKYSPENRTVWVDLSGWGLAARRLAVRVRDQGIGIPAAEQKEIFRKFVRGAASKDASIQGTGVGLAMARQIVAAHGGDIFVESQVGEGSVFTVLLPVLEGESKL
jgi:signal transduction histidine kinase